MRRFSLLILFSLIVVCGLATGCVAPGQTRTMTVTAYCGCGKCNGYTRGHWYLLKLDFWNRVNADGSPYTGRTANGDRLRLYHPGLVSLDSLRRPWLIPPRVVFPWLWLPQDGTIAADTTYYPFGTRMFVPGWGWGCVEDRGSAIKGPDHIDIHLWLHGTAQDWGRPRLPVEIVPPAD
jgi:hypothetical protein